MVFIMPTVRKELDLTEHPCSIPVYFRLEMEILICVVPAVSAVTDVRMDVPAESSILLLRISILIYNEAADEPAGTSAFTVWIRRC